jgi:hypothetical protein
MNANCELRHVFITGPPAFMASISDEHMLARRCGFWAGMLLLLTSTVRADYADSVWLDYQNGLVTSGDILLTDMSVEQTALYTYYAALNWDTGYMGVQRAGDGRYKHVHYSLWDPSGGGFADLVWNDSDVVVQRFGGEGTGWKVEWPYLWNQGTTYRFCVKLTNSGANTDYDAYFFAPELGSWKHLATLRRHDGPHSFSYVGSFVEDFGGSLNSARSALFGNGWLRAWSGTWVEQSRARFPASGTYTNKDAGVVGKMFRLATGGITTNHTPVNTTLTRTATGKTPDDCSLTITTVSNGTNVQLNWPTLPYLGYAVQWTDDLGSWPALQSAAATSNIWSQSTQGRPQRYYRIHGTR